MEKRRKRFRSKRSVTTFLMEKGKKRPKCKSSVANLSEDLIVEILLRLPVRSIARFRCVCKPWRNLLTHDISFHNMKLNHDTRKRSPKLLLTTRKQIKYDVQLRSVISGLAVSMKYPLEQQFDHNIRILGSCNGLICASNRGIIMYVWNPCTKEYKIILSPNKPIGFQTNRHLIIDSGYGFGYDSQTCDYKFVSILGRRNMSVSGVEIYYLGSDSWKTYSSCIPYKVTRDPGVFLNGALHWLADTCNEDSQSRRVILSFDMKDEIFKEIPQPEHTENFDYKFVEVLRGCLCLLCSVCKVGFEIWEMKDYGVRESWSKMFKADKQLMTGLDIPFYHYLRSAVSLMNGEIVLQVRLHGDSDWQERSSVVKVCLEEKSRHQKGRKIARYIVQMVPYMESLVSVKSGRHVGLDEQEREDYFQAIKNL